MRFASFCSFCLIDDWLFCFLRGELAIAYLCTKVYGCFYTLLLLLAFFGLVSIWITYILVYLSFGFLPLFVFSYSVYSFLLSSFTSSAFLLSDSANWAAALLLILCFSR